MINTNDLLAYEQWKPVVGLEAYYEVSNLGRVRSIGSGQGRRTGRILNQWIGKGGYVQIELQVGLKSMGPLVHTLVAAAFIGPRPQGKEVDHIDGVKTNNCVLNLHYLTRSENIIARNDRLRKLGLPLTGLQHGEHNPQAKLKYDDVIEIRRFGKEGMVQRKIAELFGVRRETIGKIIRNERWK